MTATKVDVRRQNSDVTERLQRIPLTQDQVATVADDDHGWLSEWKWYAWWSPAGKTFYAARSVATGLERPKQRMIRMHNVIWEHHNGPIPDGMTVDHANRDTLDNRLSNLRLATDSQQRQNRRVFKNNISGYRGVTWHKQRGKWQAKITVNRKQIHLGHFTDKDDAARAYNRAAEEHFGEFALLNTIPES
jgi:hypothetical protein